jgi:hypothetical protein
MGKNALLADNFQGISNKRNIMLYTNYYIIESNQLVNLGVKDPCGTIAIPAGVHNLADIYDIANSLPSAFKFCLYFDNQPIIDKKAALDIIAFFFLPDYYRSQGHPQILVANKNETEYVNFTSLLTECALLQGFENIGIARIADSSDHTSQLYFDNESSKIGDAYARLISETDNYSNGLFIKANGVDGMEAICLLLKQEEEKFAAGNPMCYSSKKEIKRHEEEIYKLNILLQSAEQELTNHQAHTALLRSNSYASHLQNYYDNEYEILPGWYKKLGQLIKTLSGKRTFMSLLNKKVKKYKD